MVETATIATWFEESGDGPETTTSDEGVVILSVTLQDGGESAKTNRQNATTTDLYLLLDDNDETTASPISDGRQKQWEPASVDAARSTTTATQSTTDNTEHTTPPPENQGIIAHAKPHAHGVKKSAFGSKKTTTQKPTSQTKNMRARGRAATVGWVTHDGIDATRVASTDIDVTTRSTDLSTPIASLSFAVANTTALLADTRRGDTGDGNSNDIIPIVGAVCAVVGVLLGVILSACVWLYISRRRLRQRRHGSSIKKNPEEKTFERLDFNLTLPREQDTGGSPASGYGEPQIHDGFDQFDEAPPGSSYRHFEEPTPYGSDVFASGAIRPRSVYDDTGSVGERQFSPSKHQLMRHKEDVNLAYRNEEEFGVFTDIHTIPALEHGRRYNGRHSPAEPSRASYIALVQHDSDQSTISRLSSIATIEGNRRASSCTYRTDLPDSDGSNSSVGGGYASVTGSLARDRPGQLNSSSYAKDHDFLPSESSYFSDVNTISTRAPSPLAPTAGRRDFIAERAEEGDGVSTTSSSEAFTNAQTVDVPQETASTKDVEREDSVERSLNYFDIELPPASFVTGDNKSPVRRLSKNSIHSDKSETTIHL